MIWGVRVGADHQPFDDLGRSAINPLEMKIGQAILYDVQGQFSLFQPSATFTFQTGGYLGWGVKGGPAFRDDIHTYLNLAVPSTQFYRSRIYISDPLNFLSWGWYLEEPPDKGEIGSHIIFRGRSFLPPAGIRGIDVCFNNTDKKRGDYFPSPSNAFFEVVQSFTYLDPSDPDLPRICCPLLVRSDWWDRLRLFIRIFDTVYILRPTEYSRQCYYRLIEDELPAILTILFSRQSYQKVPLNEAMVDSFGSTGRVPIFFLSLAGRIGFDYIAPSFAQPSEIDQPFAPLPLNQVLSPPPPFVRDAAPLLHSAEGKRMTYSPYSPGPCMYSGPLYEGVYNEITNWGIVPVIVPMTEGEFDQWLAGEFGGFTLFSIGGKNGQPFIASTLPLLVWKGTCGDYIIFMDEIRKEDEETWFHKERRVMAEGWITSAGGVKVYRRYFAEVTATASFYYLNFDKAYAYIPPSKEVVEEKVSPYFVVERVHTLTITRKRFLLLKPKGFLFSYLGKVDFSKLDETINEEAEEFVAIDFGTHHPELSSSFPGPQWLCSNVAVKQKSGQPLHIEWNSDKISVFYAQGKTSGNRRFFLKRLIPLLRRAYNQFLSRFEIDTVWSKIISEHAPQHALLTGWKGFHPRHRSLGEMPWTMLSNGAKITFEEKLKHIGCFVLFRRVPMPAELSTYERAVGYLRHLIRRYFLLLPGGKEESYFLLPYELPSPTVLSAFPWLEGDFAEENLRTRLRALFSNDVFCEFGAFVPIPLSIVGGDPAKALHLRDNFDLPNKILFAAGCVDPPELQSIADWYLWLSVISVNSSRITHTEDFDGWLRSWLESEVDFPSPDRRQEYLRRLTYLVGGFRWCLPAEVELPKSWDEWAQVFSIFDFSHLPIVDCVRGVVQWDLDRAGRRYLMLAPYLQPIFMATTKEPPLPDSWGFSRRNAIHFNGYCITVARTPREDTVIDPIHNFEDSLSDRLNLGESLVVVSGGKLENFPTKLYRNETGGFTNVRLQNRIWQARFHLLDGYFASFPDTSLFYPQHAPVYDDVSLGLGLGDFLRIPYVFRFFRYNSLLVNPHQAIHPYLSSVATKENYLVELTSLLPQHHLRFEPPQSHALDWLKMLFSFQPPFAVPLFYEKVGYSLFGKARRRWESEIRAVGGVFAGGGVGYRRFEQPFHEGVTDDGHLVREMIELGRQGSPLYFELASSYQQWLRNHASIFYPQRGAGFDRKYVHPIFLSSDWLENAYLVGHPYHRWLGGMLVQYPVFNFRVGGVSHNCFLFGGSRGLDDLRVEDAFRFLPFSHVRSYFIGLYRGVGISMDIGIPPLPSDFVPQREVPSDELDLGVYWKKVVDLLKKQVSNPKDSFAFPITFFTWVLPPWGWIGCVSAPNVDPLLLQPIYPQSQAFESLSFHYAYGNNAVPLSWKVVSERLPQQPNASYFLSFPSPEVEVLEDIVAQARSLDRGKLSRLREWLSGLVGSTSGVEPEILDALTSWCHLWDTSSEVKDFSVIEIGDEVQKRRERVLPLVWRGELRKRFFFDFHGYVLSSRMRMVLQEDEKKLVRAPEEVVLDAERVKVNGSDVIIHKIRSSRPRYYLLPLFPVNHVGLPYLLRVDNKAFHVDLMPSEYGSVAFTPMVAAPIPFGTIKKEIADAAEKMLDDSAKMEIKRRLVSFLRDTLWLLPTRTKEDDITLQEAINMIPDGFLVGQPWYAPFAAYYIPTYSICPFPHVTAEGASFVFSFINPYAFRQRNQVARRIYQINVAPTVYPEHAPFSGDELLRNPPPFLMEPLPRRYSFLPTFSEGERRRLPVAIVAMQSSFVNGGAFLHEPLSSLVWWSVYHIPDLNFGFTSPLRMLSAVSWLVSLFSQVPTCDISMLLKSHERLHVMRMLTSWKEDLGLTSSSFLPPFAIVPYQRYPFSLPSFVPSPLRPFWRPLTARRYGYPYRLYGVGFHSSLEDLCLLEDRFENSSTAPLLAPSYTFPSERREPGMWDAHEMLIVVPDFVMPMQTIGTRLLGGYGEFHRIILPPAPLIVHSSFNYGWAEFRNFPHSQSTFLLHETVKNEDLFDFVVKPPFAVVRNFIRGIQLTSTFPTGPDAASISDTLRVAPYRLVETNGLLIGGHWSFPHPDRFHWHYLRRIEKEEDFRWYSENHPGAEEIRISPALIFANHLVTRPELLVTAWRYLMPSPLLCRPFLSLEVQDVVFTSDGKMGLVVLDNSYPRLLVLPCYVSSFQKRGTGGGFSDIVSPPLTTLFYLYYPIVGSELSPYHHLTMAREDLVIKIAGASGASIKRPQHYRSSFIEQVAKNSMCPPVGQSFLRVGGGVISTAFCWSASRVEAFPSQYYSETSLIQHLRELNHRIETLWNRIFAEMSQWNVGVFLSRGWLRSLLSSTAETSSEHAIVGMTFIPILLKNWVDDVPFCDKIEKGEEEKGFFSEE